MANSEEESTRTTAIIDFKHTVLAKFKSDLPTQQLQQLIQGLEELCSHLDFVKSFEWGTDFRQVKRQKGFTHIFVITFYGPEGLGAYVSHPLHKSYA
uniref:Stress-response A/B barrel domain-containing protein n=1 Tax=Picea sitchensis TaxID=3332 RepID=A9NQL3_PICSI|nr:unknown [Picea sitchensis]